MAFRSRAALAFVASLALPAYVLGSGSGCGSDAATTPTDKTAAAEVQTAPPLKHEPCEDSQGRVETVDINNDGKPDIRRILDKGTGRELCRIADLNHDGKPEIISYYDEKGDLRRREASYETSDAVSAIDYFEGGKLVRRELDTTGQRKVDTTDTFDPATGKRTKRERDTNGDGKVDQWWVWDGDKLTIDQDKNFDGQPDPDATLVSGPGGTLIPLASLADAAAEASGPSAPPPPTLGDAGTGEGGAAGAIDMALKMPPPPVVYPNGQGGVALDAGVDSGKKKGTR
jgi:hypothetical protein